MKKALLLAVAFLVSLPLGLSAQTDTPSEGYYANSYARLSYVNGDVFVERTAGLGYEKGDLNLALVQGDKLGTGSGQAEVHFGRGNYLRLDDNTKVEFAVLPREGDDTVKIHVLQGHAYLRVGSLAAEKGIEIHSPDASCYVLEEGLYRFDVRTNGETEVLVREGSLEAAAEGGSVVVRSGESVVASNGRLLGDPSRSDSRSDAFDQWNGSRDTLIAPRTTTQHLPSGIDEYENELDQNGNWVYENPYGYVWTPGMVDADWRPYLNGRWVWYPNIGWNWVSSESWGWPVYHYGRWHWRVGLGWYWIPHNSWGPAWVHWWWDNDYIGWCPLGWYNRPVVLMDNFFYDHFRGPNYPLHNRAMSIIRRNQLQEHGINRHMLRSNELGRLSGQISLRAEQPSTRPIVNRTGLQNSDAQRVLASKPGIRSGAKSFAPDSRLSSGQLRQSGANMPSRRSDNTSALENRGGVSRDQMARPASNQAGASERTIRSYPSSRTNGTLREGSLSRDGRAETPRSLKSGDSAARDSQVRVYPSQTNKQPASRQESSRSAQPEKRNGSESTGSSPRTGGRIKNYPSSSSVASSSLAPRSSTSSRWQGQTSSFANRTYPSRVNSGYSSSRGSAQSYPSRSSNLSSSSRSLAPSGSAASRSYRAPERSPSYSAPSRNYARPSSPSVSRSAPRSYAPSYSSSRSSSPRYSAPSQSRSSYSAPSRSSGSVGRSSGSSSSNRSSSSSSRSASSKHSSSGRK